jgi:hypothetical protein
VKYADMKECDTSTGKDAADKTKGCTVYLTKSATVESDGWTGSYVFPTAYNHGKWTQQTGTSGTPDKFTAAHEGTKEVHIYCIRPTAQELNQTASGPKAIYLQYHFDVTGINAAANSGSYFVYDPTVTTKSGAGSGSPTKTKTYKTTVTAQMTCADADKVMADKTKATKAFENAFKKKMLGVTMSNTHVQKVGCRRLQDGARKLSGSGIQADFTYTSTQQKTLDDAAFKTEVNTELQAVGLPATAGVLSTTTVQTTSTTKQSTTKQATTKQATTKEEASSAMKTQVVSVSLASLLIAMA